MHDVDRKNKKEKIWTVMRKMRGRKGEERVRGKKKGKARQKREKE